MQIHTIESLLDHVKTAGRMALEQQRGMRYSEIAYKDDGSVVTEADRKVEDFLFERVAEQFPQANVLTEETLRSFDHSKRYTFAIDPIDGTDVFSQGMPNWCVSVGLLDAELSPIGGIVFAPRLELLFFAEVGKRATVNGAEIPLRRFSEPLSSKSNIMVASRIHRYLDLSGFPGKVRSIGSAALHICLPLMYPKVCGAVEGHWIHIWDIAGAHAMNLSAGCTLEYWEGGDIDYSTMLDGSPAGDIVLAGTRERIEELRQVLARGGSVPSCGEAVGRASAQP